MGTDNPALRKMVVEYAWNNMCGFSSDFVWNLLLRIQHGWNSQTVHSSLKMLLKLKSFKNISLDSYLDQVVRLVICSDSELRSVAYWFTKKKWSSWVLR